LPIADPISGLAGEREDLQGHQGDGAGVLVGFHQLRQLHQFISFVWVENEESDREGEGERERENKIK
jgi:hypothetical protein